MAQRLRVNPTRMQLLKIRRRLATALRGYRTVAPKARTMPDGRAAFAHYISEDIEAVDRAYRQFAVGLVQ